MKIITNKTLLKQGDKTYPPVEVEGVIYWEKDHVKSGNFVFNRLSKEIVQTNQSTCVWFNRKIVAQSQPKLEGIPVISLDKRLVLSEEEKNELLTENKSFIGHAYLYYRLGYNSNPNHYTQKDIEKVYKLLIDSSKIYTYEEIIEQINSISVIEVDENFQIISYE